MGVHRFHSLCTQKPRDGELLQWSIQVSLLVATTQLTTEGLLSVGELPNMPFHRGEFPISSLLWFIFKLEIAVTFLFIVV